MATRVPCPRGAETESTLRANVDAFSTVALWPRCMVDVSDVNLTCSVPTLGLFNLSAPLMVSPVAMQMMAHPDGERGVARACSTHGVGYCASQQSTMTIEEIGRGGGDGAQMFFQLYMLRDREQVIRLVRRAEASGASALAVTVDAPTLGRRERDVRNGFKLREGLKLANVEAAAASATAASSASTSGVSKAQSSIAKRIGNRDSGFSWKDLAWLKSATKLPMVLKVGLYKSNSADP